MPSSVRNDDFILYDDKVLYKVITIQPHIPHWESWRHTYTMFTLQAEDGRILPVPDLHGEHIIARPLRKVES